MRESEINRVFNTHNSFNTDNAELYPEQASFTPRFPEDFNVPDLKADDRDTSLLRKASKVVLAGLAATVAAELISFRKNGSRKQKQK